MNENRKRIVTMASRVAAGCAAAIIIVSAGTALAASPSVSVTGAAESAATTCILCHGVDGRGRSDGVARLAGQNADYMSNALSMFKAKTRASAVMQPIAQALSNEEMRTLADYFSKQSAPLADAAVATSPTLEAAGKELAENGAANVAACFSCHAAQGKGNGARFPSLAGQPARFIADRLHAFQARARASEPKPGTMTAVSAPLTPVQIDAAAAYLSKLER